MQQIYEAKALWVKPPETKVSVSHVVMVLLVTAVASPIFLTSNEEIISSIQLGICGLLISLHWLH